MELFQLKRFYEKCSYEKECNWLSIIAAEPDVKTNIFSFLGQVIFQSVLFVFSETPKFNK